jgi:hypothetical protein
MSLLKTLDIKKLSARLQAASPSRLSPTLVASAPFPARTI